MADLIEELTRVIQGDVLSDTVSLGVYATDASVYEEMPRVVVVPRDENDVRQAVAISASHGATILPRGGGTSLAGQASGLAAIHLNWHTPSMHHTDTTLGFSSQSPE